MEDHYNENAEESVVENSPYSPLYIPEQNKKNNRITIVLVGILLLCLVIGMILAVAKLVQEAEKEVAANLPAWKESFQSFQEELKKEVQEPYSKKPEEGVYIPEEEYGYGEEEIPYVPEEEYGYDEEGSLYVPQAEDAYYVELADAIRDDLSYQVSKKDYSYVDETGGVLVYVEYPQVNGTGFDDKFNEILETSAMYYAKELGASNVTDTIVAVTSYVTYMDEDMISVVLDETYSMGSMYYQTDLYCLNFDMKMGTCHYNTEIIQPSAALVQAFRDMSEYQNGTIENLDRMSDEEILSYFSDEDSLILFYTPVGLEIGFNYEEGWITATLKDYEQYLNRL